MTAEIESAFADICAAIESVTSSFSKDELAYLALSKKIEGTLRDRMAFLLQSTGRCTTVEMPLGRAGHRGAKRRYLTAAQNLRNQLDDNLKELLFDKSKTGESQAGGLILSKGAIDLALWDEDQSKVALGVEIKQMYTFDLWHSQIEVGMQRGIIQDLLRCRCAADTLSLPHQAFAVVVFVVGFTKSPFKVDRKRVALGFPYWAGKHRLEELIDEKSPTDRINLDRYWNNGTEGFWERPVGPGRGRRVIFEKPIGDAFGLRLNLSAWILSLET